MQDVLDDKMNQISSNPDSNSLDNDDSTESNRLSPPSKRICQSSDPKVSLPSEPQSVLVDLIGDDIKENKNECQSCGKQEILLRAFNCPSLHYFCLNCIFNWTKKHIQTKTPPTCLVIDCGYLLKHDDLDDLPIAMKDHQILLQLIQVNIEESNKTNNYRLKCDKCCLYIDQHDFFMHYNQCLGRSGTIPCEICYCPILIDDYEQHMLLCTNDDNQTLAQFLFKHLQNPNIDEKLVKLFVSSWIRKHRGAIDVYEIIEELNRTNGISKETCDMCKNEVQSDEFFFINCYDNHSSCLLCYKQRLQNQMNNDEILTCHQCTYHLQDKDLSEARILTAEDIILFQNYQSKKVFELYNSLYGAEDDPDINPTSQPQPQQQNNTSIVINDDNTPRRKCELCSKQHAYGNIFVLHCNCKICYDCFADEVNRQRTTTNELLICPLCRSPIKHNDLTNLRLMPAEVHAIQLYQQGKLFVAEHAEHFKRQDSNRSNNSGENNDDDDFDISLLNQQQCLPKYWTLPMLTNFSRHTLDAQSTEYIFVSDRFNQSWANIKNQMLLPAPTIKASKRLRPPRSLPMAGPTAALPSLPPPPPPLPQPAPPPSSLIGPQPQLSSSNFAPPINSYHPRHFPGGILPMPPPLQAPVNNNAPATNQQLGPNNLYSSLFYPRPPGMNPPPSQPPSLPFPNVPFVTPQPPYGHNMLYPSATGPSSMRISSATPVAPPPPKPPTLGISKPEIIQIERIQNQRWYKQYSAHQYEFRQKLGKQTEQWLFHGCDERSAKNIEGQWFNRSYAGQHAAAFGQGCYFARDSLYSHSYSVPDRNGIRRMFLARVLVGNTTQGNSTMRVPPSGYDTTGDGQNIFVTYHDSQAYAEYLITYR